MHAVTKQLAEEDVENEVATRRKDIEKALPNLIALRSMVRAHTETFNEACKSVALMTGMEASVLKTYVNALEADKREEYEKKTDQLTFLFEEIKGQ